MKGKEDILLKPAVKIQVRWPVNFIDEDVVEFKDEQVYTTYDCYLKQFSKVWVSPDSVIYKNGILIKESLPSKQYEGYYKFKHAVKKILTAKKITLAENKKYLLVTDLWSAGHFHWFCDIFPKLLCIRDRAREFVLLLPDTPYTKTIAIESLELLQFGFEDVLFMKDDSFYKVKHLCFISKLSPSGHMHAELVKQVRNKFIDHKPAGKKRIYISRDKAAYRKVLNEDALCNVLKEYGFEILYAEGLSLAEQIKIFSSSEALLSIHGAGLTNCIFMPPAGKVIELRKREGGGSNVGYWHLADSLDHQYYYYNGITDSDQPLVGRGCNLSIPVEDFENKILKKL